jgi:hypothetical protein
MNDVWVILAFEKKVEKNMHPNIPKLDFPDIIFNVMCIKQSLICLLIFIYLFL